MSASECKPCKSCNRVVLNHYSTKLFEHTQEVINNVGDILGDDEGSFKVISNESRDLLRTNRNMMWELLGMFKLVER